MFILRVGSPKVSANFERSYHAIPPIDNQDLTPLAMFCLRAWVPLLFLPTNASPVFVVTFFILTYFLNRPCICTSNPVLGEIDDGADIP